MLELNGMHEILHDYSLCKFRMGFLPFFGVQLRGQVLTCFIYGTIKESSLEMFYLCN